MARATCIVVVTFLVSALIPPAHAQESEEVKRLKEKIELLETKLELAKRDNEVLKKRIDELAKEGSQKNSETKPIQPKPIVINDFQIRVVSCVLSGNEMTCKFQITALVRDQGVALGGASATFDNAKKLVTGDVELAGVKGPRLFAPGVRLDKDAAVELTIKFKDVPKGVAKVVVLDFGSRFGEMKLRDLEIQTKGD